MFTTFQKAVLATIAGSALLLAFVLAAKTPALAASGIPGVLGSDRAALSAGSNGGIAPGIVTTGGGTTKVKPDIAIIGAGATVQSTTAADAQSKVAERIAKILAAAKALGVADRDIQSSGYSIQPQYSYGRGGDQPQTPTIVGYQATQMVSITFRKVDEAGKALDALVRNEGATNASLTFALEDMKPAQAEARRRAIEDAKSKAEAMARTAGVRVGKVVSITDQSVSLPYRDAKFGLGAAPAQQAAPDTQVPVGDLEIVVSVQVQFAIE